MISSLSSSGSLTDENQFDEKVILFSRYPEPGRTKTRLIPSLGPVGAADLHRRLAEKTIATLRELRNIRPVSIDVRYDGGEEHLMREWLGPDFYYTAQGAGDLGDRMARAFGEAFGRNSRQVILIGTDCPYLTPEILQKALEELKSHDLVLGPAWDGGYYLIGLLEKTQPLFSGISWGTDKVLEQTRQKARDQKLKELLLESLPDIDRPEDLPLWYQISDKTFRPIPRISIIIPTFNEEDCLTETLDRIPQSPFIEVIVVDGGSQDKTPELAQSRGAKVFASSQGRANQLNAGARAAKGDILLFLHADTLLPKGFSDQVRGLLSDPGIGAGAFQLSIRPSLPGLGIIERMANWRSRVFQMPYGDQGIFIRAELFGQLGGFPDIPIMEDVEFIRRLKRRGRIVTVPDPVVTSSRRWGENGVWRTTIKNQAALFGYFLGIPPIRLAAWYHRKNK